MMMMRWNVFCSLVSKSNNHSWLSSFFSFNKIDFGISFWKTSKWKKTWFWVFFLSDCFPHTHTHKHHNHSIKEDNFATTTNIKHAMILFILLLLCCCCRYYCYFVWFYVLVILPLFHIFFNQKKTSLMA